MGPRLTPLNIVAGTMCFTFSSNLSMMKNMISLSRNMVKQDLSLNASDVLAIIKQAERKTFPRNEAFDFDTELRKRNTEIVVIIGLSEATDIVLYAYLVYARKSRLALLHKVCVIEEHQAQGIASGMVEYLEKAAQGYRL